MPPVLGPVSPSPIALWSWADTCGAERREAAPGRHEVAAAAALVMLLPADPLPSPPRYQRTGLGTAGLGTAGLGTPGLGTSGPAACPAGLVGAVGQARRIPKKAGPTRPDPALPLRGLLLAVLPFVLPHPPRMTLPCRSCVTPLA